MAKKYVHSRTSHPYVPAEHLTASTLLGKLSTRCWNMAAGICSHSDMSISEVRHWCWVTESGTRPNSSQKSSVGFRSVLCSTSFTPDSEKKEALCIDKLEPSRLHSAGKEIAWLHASFYAPVNNTCTLKASVLILLANRCVFIRHTSGLRFKHTSLSTEYQSGIILKWNLITFCLTVRLMALYLIQTFWLLPATGELT